MISISHNICLRCSLPFIFRHSTKHAGFVINVGGATSADVEELIRQVQQAVYAAHGVHLEPEVRIVR